MNSHTSIAAPSDFRRIPLGDIDLRHEIRLNDDSGIVDRCRGRGPVRRMYSAKIDGQKASMTVTLFEGYNAEQEWRTDISRYSGLRHPNIVQIFAVASSSGIHAIVAHGDLIPVWDFLGFYSNSPILTLYIQGYVDTQFWVKTFKPCGSGPSLHLQEAYQYLDQMCRRYIDSTVWIRRSTGRLCVDLTPRGISDSETYVADISAGLDSIVHLNDPNLEAMIIDSLELQQCYDLCGCYPRDWGYFSLPMHVELHLGAVMFCHGSRTPQGFNPDGLVEIAFPDAYPRHDVDRWHIIGRTVGEIMEDGWTRYNSHHIFGATISASANSYEFSAWLSQANHIFSRLHITSSYEDYAIVEGIELRLGIAEPAQSRPQGYLFVCPFEDLNAGASSYRWPGCPAYWSLDPSGAKRLGAAEAMHLGFPSIELAESVVLRTWDVVIYDALREVHQAKGFADSQDIARHLGLPLYRLSRDINEQSAHVSGEIFDVEIEGENNFPRSNTDTNLHELTPRDVGPDPFFDAAEILPSSRSWKIVMAVKFGLILALTFVALYEYVRKVL